MKKTVLFGPKYRPYLTMGTVVGGIVLGVSGGRILRLLGDKEKPKLAGQSACQELNRIIPTNPNYLAIYVCHPNKAITPPPFPSITELSILRTFLWSDYLSSFIFTYIPVTSSSNSMGRN
jgi:hypothetical protein